MPRRLLPCAIVVLALLTFSVSSAYAWDTSPYLLGTWAPETSPHPTSYFIGNPTTKPLDVYALFHGRTGIQGGAQACYKYTIPANGTWYLTDPSGAWDSTGGPGTAKFFAFPQGTTTFDPNAVIGGFQQEIVTPYQTQTVQLFSEDFEGDWPPPGWTVTRDEPGYTLIVWHRSDQYPYNGANPGPPISGLHAYAESYYYCGASKYDTSLVTPSFSTLGMDSVEVRFDYQYSQNITDTLTLQYSLNDGNTWVTLETLPNTGPSTVQSRTVDISVTGGNPNVQLRWRYYWNYSAPMCDWWTSLDNIQVTGNPRQVGPCHIMDMNLKAVTINSATVGEFAWLKDVLKTTGCHLWEVPLPPVPGRSFCPPPGIIAVPIIPGPFF
jgi:hypothetical protein